jgi:hypothetical protein
MRVLEQCIASWPMPHLKAQIDALREAFSVDPGKPFVFKRSILLPKPSSLGHYPNASTSSVHSASHSVSETSHAVSKQHLDYMGQHAISPPLSTSGLTSQSSSPSAQPSSLLGAGQAVQPHHAVAPPAPTATNMMAWNPSKIFEYVDGPFYPRIPP